MVILYGKMKSLYLSYRATLVLATLIIFSSFGKTILLLGFVANQDYIAKNLCENRYQTERLCSGKCVLTKTIQKHDGQDSEKWPLKLKDLKENTAYFFNPPAFVLERTSIISILKPIIYSKITIIPSYLQDIFHPPQ
ncbi:MAG: hypothetical protein IPH36_19980 [Saprospiraceae bacterium]|nr:hypothetical protein [Saprospiraceae bacterium]